MFAPGVEEYATRLGHYAKFSLQEIAPSRKSGALAREEEGRALLAALKRDESLIALDERGDLLGSVEFAREVLGRAQQRARDLVFVVGGDEGLSPEVRERAERTVSLSKMTLPHRLARLVLVEQIYRGFTLLKGEPYHK